MAADSPEVLAVPSGALLDFYDRTEFRSDPEGVRDALNVVRSPRTILSPGMGGANRECAPSYPLCHRAQTAPDCCA